MATIKLNKSRGGFKLIPEGWHDFKITDVSYDETFGKVEVDLFSKDGYKHTERFTLINKQGNVNEGAVNVFSYFVSTAMDDWDIEEIDPDELVGRYISGEIKYTESKKINENTGKPYIFANLGDKKPLATGWDEEFVEVEEEEDVLGDLLGMLD